MSQETVENILRQGRSHLEALGAEVALVMMLNDNKLVIRKASGVESQDLSARAPLFDLVTEKKTSILVLDTVQDRRFESLPDEVRSVLCAPILDDEEMLGLLYAEASRPGVFSHKAQEDTVNFGRELGQRVQKAELEEQQRTAAPPSIEPTAEETAAAGKQLLIPALLLLAALLWPLMGGYFNAAPPTATPTPAEPALTAEFDPSMTIRSFLLLLQFQKYEQAYGLFSTEYRKRCSQDEFTTAARAWVQGNSGQLEQRETVLEQRRSDKAVVSAKAALEGAKTWTYKLDREGQSWFIQECQGGPGQLRATKASPTDKPSAK